MDVEANFVITASLIGEPARAAMLWNLLDGKAYTATELAIAANISAQAASNHLNKLLEANLLQVNKQGRHRYYSFARAEVAYAMEALASLVTQKQTSVKSKSEAKSGIKYCRTCYDHLAGKVGVTITKALVELAILREKEAHYLLTEQGRQWFDKLNVNIEASEKIRRAFARKCLDWSEREPHLAGYLGAQLLDKMTALDWFRKMKHSREIILTSEGKRKLYEFLKITL